MAIAWDEHKPPELGPDRGLRALRLLPADVPELRGVRGGDGLAARADRADADRPRGGREVSPRDDHALRPLPRLHGVRDRLPVGRAVRPADRAGRARSSSATATATRGERAVPAAIFALFTHPGRLRALAPMLALQRPPGDQRAARGARMRRGRGCRRCCASRRASKLRTALARLPEVTPAQGTAARPDRADAGLRPARVLRRRQRRHRARARRRGLGGPRAARAALLRRADAARRRRARGAGARARDDRRLRGLRRRRGQRRRLRLGDEGVRPPARPTTRSGRSARRRSWPRSATSTSCWPSTSRRRERHPLPMKVAYHDACHLAHAQGVRSQPRELLRGIPGLELVEPADWEICCGSAGHLQPRPAARPPPSSAPARPPTSRPPAPRRSPPPTPAARSRSPPTWSGRRCPIYHPMTLLDLSIRGERP